MSIYKFPHTPHLVQLGTIDLRQDKLLKSVECDAFIASEIIIEEKIDGANIGISFDSYGEILVQNRGSYIRQGSHPQFSPLWNWVYERIEYFKKILGKDHILFGEWCYAKHSLRYTQLPDWFIGFDIFKKPIGKFLSVKSRDKLLKDMDVCTIPQIAEGKFSIDYLISLVRKTVSKFSQTPIEGIYLRLNKGNYLEKRAKIVREEFIQAIETHWSKQALEKNKLKRK